MQPNGDRPRAVFFDMDDTLLDDTSDIDLCWELACRDVAPGLGVEWAGLQAAIRREGRNFWRDEAAVGHWRVKLEEAREHVVALALAAEGLDPAHAARLAQKYSVERLERLRPFDDAIETLDALRAAGLHLGLITNGPREMQRTKIARFGLAAYMDVIVIEGEFGHGKPAAAVFEHALATVGARPHEAWMVGDNLYADIGGAMGVGMHAVWIHRDRLELREDLPVIPDRMIGHLGELTDLLLAG